MRFLAIASDYDGTLAENGRVGTSTIAALERWRRAGGSLVLVTGRELPDLQRIFPAINLFDFIVAENGAVLFEPKSGVKEVLAVPASAQLISELERRGVGPLSIGDAIIDTYRLHENAVRSAIRELGLDLSIILNQDSLMVLPVGVHKGTGLEAALARMGLRREQVIAVGDAENDMDLFESCGYRVAVANAISELRARADWVSRGACGSGVAELVARILSESAD